MNSLEQVAAVDWQAWVIDNDALVLDVRQPDEWNLGTLPDALLISMPAIPDRMGELPRDRAILCVCRSGDRSGRVASFLSFQGFGRVANMAGGLKALGMQA